MVDVVQMCGYEEEDSKTVFIGKGVIKNVAGGMLHLRVISKGYVSLTITESCKDNYPLLDPLSEDNPPITIIGNTKGILLFGQLIV